MKSFRRAAIVACLALAAACSGRFNTSAQPITNPGPPRIIIMPGARLQLPGGGGVDSPIVPGVSVVQAKLDPDAPAFGHAEFDPPTVTPGTRSTYRLVVSSPQGSVSPPEPLSASGLALERGASGEQLVVVSGKVWRILTFNYYATASTPGTFTVPGYMIDRGGTPVAVGDATLNVIAAQDDNPAEPLELILEVPERKVFVGETLPVHISISRSRGGMLQNITKLELTGEALLTDPNSIYVRQAKTIANIGGRQAITIETDALVTPLREGTLTMSARAEVSLGPQPGIVSLLPGYRPLVESAPAVIRVVNVPTNLAPPGYNGAIGRLELEPPKLSTNIVRVGDPVTLSVTLRGEGNLQTLAPPPQPRAENWHTLPPRSDPVRILDPNNSARSFHYTLIPLATNITATPAIPFSAFNPANAAFVNLSIPPQPVTVTALPRDQTVAPPADTSAQTPSPTTPPAPEEQLQGLVDTPGRPVGTLVPLQSRPAFLLAQIIPATLLASLWLWDRRRRFLAAHPEIPAMRKALRHCRARLANARTASAAGNAPEFAAAIVGALRAACAPMADANPDSIVCADVLALMPPERRAGRDGDLVRDLFTVTDARRFSRESPAADSLLARHPEAEAVVRTLLDELRSFVARAVHNRSRPSPPPSPVTPANGGTLHPHSRSGGRLALLAALVSLATASAAADGPPDLFQQGVSAYTAGRYDEAAAAFRQSAAKTPSHGTLQNLGNAEWRRGHVGEAILAWERAAWLNGFDRNSRENLRYARKTARLDDPPVSWFEACSAWLPSTVWAWTAAASFWFAAALLVLPQALRWRKASWHQAGVAVGLTLFLLTLPALTGIHSRTRRGVVIAESAPVRLSPTRDGEVLARLPAGETARFTRTRNGFFHVRTATGVTGWVDRQSFQWVTRE